MCPFLCLVIASVLLCYKYLFLYDFLFIYPKASIGVREKVRVIEFSEASDHWFIEKITAPKISAYFPPKHPGWSLF